MVVRFVPQAAIVIAAIGLFICTEVWRRFTAEAADDPGGSWSTNGITQAVLGSDGVTQTNKASDAGNPIATSGKRFIQLRVIRQ